MVAFEERLDGFESARARILGANAHSPFSQGACREQHGIDFDLVSDMARKGIRDDGREMDIPELRLNGTANHAVVVLDADGTITYV